MRYRTVCLVLLTAVALSGRTRPALAIPSLQLDIAGGAYDSSVGVETTFSTAPSFALYALLLPDSKNPLTDTYSLSIALVPQISAPAPLGSFAFNGSTYEVTADLVFGVPPIETDGTAGKDGGDLPEHGIFETYFTEVGFTFNPLNKATVYNVPGAPNPHPGPTPNLLGTMYYQAFVVDTSGLGPGYAIHFDLYNMEHPCLEHGPRGVCLAYATDLDITDKAPFGADAESCGANGHACASAVPEPGSLILLGSGLVGLGLLTWRKQLSLS